MQTTGEKLNAFMVRHLRSIASLTWKEQVTNKEILDRTKLSSVDCRLECQKTDFQSISSTLNCLLVTVRVDALVSGSRTASRETVILNSNLISLVIYNTYFYTSCYIDISILSKQK